MKRVQVTITFETWEEVPDEWDENSIQFWVEENHCRSNYILSEAKDIESQPGVCNFCSRSKATVGHALSGRAPETKPECTCNDTRQKPWAGGTLLVGGFDPNCPVHGRAAEKA